MKISIELQGTDGSCGCTIEATEVQYKLLKEIAARCEDNRLWGGERYAPKMVVIEKDS